MMAEHLGLVVDVRAAGKCSCTEPSVVGLEVS